MFAYLPAASQGQPVRATKLTLLHPPHRSAHAQTRPFWRFRRPSFSALCGRRRLRFLEAAAAFLELARGHLACADSICWRDCRFPENCGYGRCNSEEVSSGTQCLCFNTYLHVRTYKHTRTHACLHTYIHTSICTHAQLRARTCMRAVAVANRMLTIARCAKANARTHMHSYMHAYMHKCLHCMDRYNDIYIMYRCLFMPVQDFDQPSAATASGPQSIGGGEGIKIGDEMKIDNLCRPEGQIIVRLSCLACLACPSVGARAQPGQWRTHMQCTCVCIYVYACTGTICLSVPHSHSTP